MHWPAGFDSVDKPEMAPANRQHRLCAWTLFEELYALGVARAIGVSNFTEVTAPPPSTGPHSTNSPRPSTPRPLFSLRCVDRCTCSS